MKKPSFFTIATDSTAAADDDDDVEVVRLVWLLLRVVPSWVLLLSIPVLPLRILLVLLFYFYYCYN